MKLIDSLFAHTLRLVPSPLLAIALPLAFIHAPITQATTPTNSSGSSHLEQISARPHPANPYSQPTADVESQALAIADTINQIRTNPSAYADWLETLRPAYDHDILTLPGEGRLRTYEGVAALDEAIAFLRSLDPLPPLHVSPGIAQSAHDHLNAMTTSGSESNTRLDDRLNRYGQWSGQAIEIQSYGNYTPEHTVLLAILNDGDPSRHARTTLLSPEYGFIGVACGNASHRANLCLVGAVTEYTDHPTEVPSVASTDVPEADQSRSNHQPQSNHQSQSDRQTQSDRHSRANHPSPSDRHSRAENSSEIGLSTPTPASDMTPIDPKVPDAPIPESEDPAVPTTADINADYLSDLEREIIAETNRLRQDPAAYAELLENLLPYFHGDLLRMPGQTPLLTHEGADVVLEAIAQLRNTPPLPPLRPSRGLSLGADDHLNDLGPKGLTGHYGSDGSSPFDRINRYGSWDNIPNESIAGENISYSPINTAQWHVMQLLIDDGVPNRGHRTTLLDPRFQVTGVACGSHSIYRYMCDITYAHDYEEAN